MSGKQAQCVVCYRSDSDSDNESGDPEKKKLQDKLSGIV